MLNFNNLSPNIPNQNSTETNEPPSKKVCIDDPSNSPPTMQNTVPPIEIKSEIDVKPNIIPSYNLPTQLMPDVKPNVEEFDSKPIIHPTLGISSPPLMGQFNMLH